MSARKSFHADLALPAVATVVFAVAMVRSAWVTEDAFIAFRTVDNFVNGFGLRWNIAERVQTYTCPLWVLLYTPFYLLTREAFHTSLWLQFALSMATIAALGWRSQRWAVFGLVVLALSASKAFIDYSTSGLENPLSHLLLALFGRLLVEWDLITPRRLLALTLIASLGVVNRLDLALLFLPGIAVAFWALTPRTRLRGLMMLLCGGLPVVAWLVFATIYYGFPVPNTAYAKLQIGVDSSRLLDYGIDYFGNSLMWDPITLPLITTGLAAAAWSRSWRPSALGFGVLLYLIYIARIGGDYMTGRFFTAPLVLAAVILIATLRFPSTASSRVALAIVLLFAIFVPRSPWRSGADYGDNNDQLVVIDRRGVADERLYYFNELGFIRRQPKVSPQAKAGAVDRALAAEGKIVSVADCAGLRCFLGGPAVHYIDPFGLGDPLLSRLPPLHRDNFRIGHFRRAIPVGYDVTLARGTNAIEDPKLADYYRRLCVATRADVWSSGRFAALLRLNLRQDDSLIDAKYYAKPVIDPRPPAPHEPNRDYQLFALPPADHLAE